MHHTCNVAYWRFCVWLVLTISLCCGQSELCTSLLTGRQLRAAGDWSLQPIWNAIEPNGLLKYDAGLCTFSLSVGGLTPNAQHKWKVVIDGTWSHNYGCSGQNGPDCSFRVSSNGTVRFVVRALTSAPPQLSTDYELTQQPDVTLPCRSAFADKIVRAAGDFSAPAPLWNAQEPRGLMSLDERTCMHAVILRQLRPNFEYNWKVAISNTWAENYGCSSVKPANGPNCRARTNEQGAVRLVFSARVGQVSSPQLSADYDFGADELTTTAATTTTTTTTSTATTTTTKSTTGTTSSTKAAATNATASAVVTNPIKTCTKPAANCATACGTSNKFSSKLLRVSGDWSIDAGSSSLWNSAEPRGLLTFEQDTCVYTLTLTGLKKDAPYKWKVTVDNSWSENYGCQGGAADCSFKTNSAGAIRFRVKPDRSTLQLTTDYQVAPCGDNKCETGETCNECAADCGECPPAVCGDGVCERNESFETCAADCPNELPGCERFNDESCRAGAQSHANEAVSQRRFQTPRPGAPGYQASFQHYHTLVGYADIRYTSESRNAADVCIVAVHKRNVTERPVTMRYSFDGAEQSDNCKRFSAAVAMPQQSVSLSVVASDGANLTLHPVRLTWTSKPLASRPGDYRNGQKGAIAELFGWPHKDVEQECELLSKAGYLGVKLFPVHEQLMSSQPFNNVLNPWYFMYQPVSYQLNGRAGTREDLQSLIDACRAVGVRVYVDAVLNHMVGAGNDLSEHRNPGAGCTRWGNKTSSAPVERQSPFYTHAFTYKYNANTGQPPSNEFPGAALFPDDFHCDRALSSWSDLFTLNNGWLVGLTDLDTSRETVRERQAAYLVELVSMGVSGFRLDAAKHISPQDLSAVLRKVQSKLGGQLPADFIVWLEVITGGESNLLWSGPSWYGSMFSDILRADLGSQSEVDKIKMWDGLYPKESGNNPMAKNRVVIQNDDHDQQSPGSSSRDMGPFGCVLVRGCPVEQHRHFETKLFQSPDGVQNNDDNWPIRFVLSSYYHTHGNGEGIPDGWSDCARCLVDCATCRNSVPYMPAHVPGACAYDGQGYTRVHRDLSIINAMRNWMKLAPVSGANIGLPKC